MAKFVKNNSDENINFGASTSGKSNSPSNIYQEYKDEYLAYGFKCTVKGNRPCPQCLICDKVLANSSMSPSKLKRHLATHPNYATKRREDFLKLSKTKAKQAEYFESYFTTSTEVRMATYKISELIAKGQHPYSFATSTILPACCEIVKNTLSEGALEDIQKIRLSDTLVRKQIKDMSLNIERNVSARLGNTPFALQLDVAEIFERPHVLAFIRFVGKDGIVNQFLCWKELSENTSGGNIYDTITLYLQSLRVDWRFCLSINAECSLSMLEHTKDFLNLAKCHNPHMTVAQCFLHREDVLVDSLPEELNPVLVEAVQVVNFIKSQMLKTHLSRDFANAMETQFENWLLHTDIRWLLKGKVLQSLLHFKEDILNFCRKEDFECVADGFKDVDWTTKLAYLCDILDHIIEGSITPPEICESTWTMSHSLLKISEKIPLWKYYVRANNFEMLPSISNKGVEDIKTSLILDHLALLDAKISAYLPKPNTTNHNWVENPFATNSREFKSDILPQEKDELLALSINQHFKEKHSKLALDQFWISIREHFPTLSGHALNILLMLPNPHLCDLALTTLIEIKSKCKVNFLDIDHKMRVALSCIRPNFTELSQKL